MATRVIYGDQADNAAVCDNAGSYATARAMGAGATTLGTASSASLTVSSPLTGTGGAAGQAVGGGTNFSCFQGFIGFDTTGISGASSATLAMFVAADSSVVDFTVEARLSDWGTAVTTADVVAGASLSGLTLLATLATSGITTSAYNDFTEVAILANLNASGFVRILLASDDQRNNVSPTGDQVVSFQSANSANAMKLTIVDSSTQSSQTLNGGATSFTPAVTGIHDLDLWSGGSKVATATAAKSGAGGGSYKFAQFTVPSLSAITVQVAATQTTNGSVGNDTWFNSSSAPDPLAKGAQGVSATVANAGGLSASGRGILGFSGGSGAAAQGGGGSRGGSSGGTSAGTAAIGVDGAVGSGAAGGAAQTAPTGGGNSGVGGAGGGGAGGAGSVPGGGGGGGGSSSGANGDGAAGKMIVYWYVYPAADTLFAQSVM